jgi:phage FluMu gp28-like protein
MTVPYVLLPYQQKWIADKSPVRISEKSRRIGMSWGQAAESALTAASENGMDSWYIGYNKDMAQEFIRDVADWAKVYKLAASEIAEYEEVFEDGDERKSIIAFRVTFASGWRVTALSSRPSNLRGKQGLVIIDEAAFHPELKELLKAALALLIWGGRVCIISTHDGVDNPFNQLIQDTLAGKFKYSHHRVTLDDALAEGLYQRICLKRGITWTPEGEKAWRDELIEFYGDGANEELFCIPAKSGGAYLSRSLIESRMVEDASVVRHKVDDAFAQLPEKEREAKTADWLEEHVAPLLEDLDPTALTYFGQDFGRTGDQTVIAPIQTGQGLHRAIPFLVELRNVPFKQQEQILFYVVDRLPRFMAGAMDARGNGQYLAEVAAQRYGATRIDQVMLSAEWYRTNMPKYKAALEDGELTIPKDADVLEDHRLIQVIDGIPRFPVTKTKGADGGQRHGDAAMACIFADFASRMEVAPIEFESVGEARADHYVNDFMGA